MSSSSRVVRCGQDLENLSKESMKISDELLGQLSKLKPSGEGGRWKIPIQALHAVLNKKKIDDTIDRLERIRNEFQFRVVVSLKTDMNAVALQNDCRLTALDRATREIIQAILTHNANSRTDLQIQTKRLDQKLDSNDALAAQRHREILNAVGALPSLLKQLPSIQFQQPIVEADSERIRKLLWFRRIDDRYEDITLEHQRTFEWIYTESPHNTFIDWPYAQPGSTIL